MKDVHKTLNDQSDQLKTINNGLKSLGDEVRGLLSQNEEQTNQQRSLTSAVRKVERGIEGKIQYFLILIESSVTSPSLCTQVYQAQPTCYKLYTGATTRLDLSISSILIIHFVPNASK